MNDVNAGLMEETLTQQLYYMQDCSRCDLGYYSISTMVQNFVAIIITAIAIISFVRSVISIVVNELIRVCADVAAFHGHAAVLRALVFAGADVNMRFSALCLASMQGHTDCVKLLIEVGVEVETRENNGQTPLYLAAGEGHVELVQFLIEHHADVNACRSGGDNCLLIAAYNGHTAVVRALVSAGADINLQNNAGLTPLMAASNEGHTDIVTMLLDSDVDIEMRNNYGRTALCCAAECGQTDVVDVLTERGADVHAVDYDLRTPLFIALMNGHMSAADRMLQHDASVGDEEDQDVCESETEWQSAMETGEYAGPSSDFADFCLTNEQMAELWKHVKLQVLQVSMKTGLYTGPLRDSVGLKELLCTANNCFLRYDFDIDIGLGLEDEDFIRFFVDCPTNKRFTESLCQSAQSNFSDIPNSSHCGKLPIDWLSKYGPLRENVDLNTFCEYASDNAIDSQHVDVGRLRDCVLTRKYSTKALHHFYYDSLLRHFHYDSLHTSCLSPPTHTDCHCNTALHLTTDLQYMRSLLENGADVETENVDGLRPIHCAVRTGLFDLVDLLIEHGANVDAADVVGNRPLHEAVCHGLTIVPLLVYCGAKVNVQNVYGETPLHVAAEHKQSEVVRFLLDEGADAGLTDVWRSTPLHYLTAQQLQCDDHEELFVKQLKKCKHLLIHTAVGVSAVSSMAAHGVLDSVIHKQKISNDSSVARSEQLTGLHIFSSSVNICLTVLQHIKTLSKTKVYGRRESLHTDCYGNTPLHYAVGVYVRLEMYRVSTDVIKTVEFLVQRGVNINSQNNDGLTPLHVARGKEAIQVCLQHADDQSFTITDKRGRNFWHLSFLLRFGENEIELATNTPSMCRTASDAKYSCDDLLRTPLHYACMRSEFTTWLSEEFIPKFSDEHINKQDKFGRTALHYAAIANNTKLMNLLKTTKAADATVRDIFENTADEYKRVCNSSEIKVSALRLLHTSSYATRNFQSISECIQRCFSLTSHNVKSSDEELHKIIRDLRADSTTSFVLNTYLGCRFVYSDVCKRTVALNKNKCERREFLPHSNESVTQPRSMFAAIQSQVGKAMQLLADEISDKDKRFACEVVPVGSAHEGTKIGCCDESDFTFVLTDLSKRCKVRYSPESPSGFVQLESSTSEYDEELFNSNGILNIRIVKFKFEMHVKQVLSSLKFCEATGFEFIETGIKSFHRYFLPPGITPTTVNTEIKLKFTHPVNGCHVPHDISVDVAPALRIDDWWPYDMHREDLCQPGDCVVVFTQPQHKYPWIDWTEPHAFISFARAENRLLRNCPHVIRAAFMAVKRMSEYFCQYNFFPSYVIKTALLWCMDEADSRSECSSSNYNGELNADELLCWVQKILRRLLCFATQDYIPSYFMPKCHQPVWLCEKYLKQFHMRLCQHGLTSYTDLFNLNEQQSQDGLLKYFKSLFIFSHVMYWTVLSDDEELKLFVPSTINPVTENDVCTTLPPEN